MRLNSASRHVARRATNAFGAALHRPRQVGTYISAQRTSRMATAAAAPAGAASSPDPIVMYVVIRGDLRGGEKGWPLGSLVAQACHASVAVIASALDDADEATREYVHPDNVDHMRKVVLETKNEETLRALGATLDAAGVAHKVWIEQPENVATWYVKSTRYNGVFPFPYECEY